MFHFIGSGIHYVHSGGLYIDRSRGVDFWVFLHTRAPFTLRASETYVSTGPAFLLLRSSTPYTLFSDSRDYADDWIHFVPEEGFSRFLLPFEQPIRITDDQEILRVMQYFDSEYHHNGLHRDMILDHCLQILFAKVNDLYLEEQSYSDSLRGHRAALLRLRQGIFQSGEPLQRSVQQIAEDMHLSPSYLQHLYKSLFGVSIKQDLIRARIERACQLLHDEKLSVAEVAAGSGYQNTEHFIRQFRRMEGCTPGQYQMRITGRQAVSPAAPRL